GRAARTAVLILSVYGSEQLVLQAMRAGASGYLMYASTPDELKHAVVEVSQGRMYLSPAISKHIVTAYLQGGTTTTSLERLTSRQRQILQLVAEGNTSKEIARKLTLSVKTVEGHRAQIMKSLEVRDVTGLVRYAIQMGLIPPA